MDCPSSGLPLSASPAGPCLKRAACASTASSSARVQSWVLRKCLVMDARFEVRGSVCRFRRSGNEKTQRKGRVRSGTAMAQVRLPSESGFRSACARRSEEHTSELQSLMAHLVCRLLLEKKKNDTNNHNNQYTHTILTK